MDSRHSNPHRVCVVLFLALACLPAGASAQAETGRSLDTQLAADGASIEITGFTSAQLEHIRQADWNSPHWRNVASVSVVSDTDDLPPVLGRWKVMGDVLQFLPRFPFNPGTAYRVTLHPLPGTKNAPNEKPLSRLLRLPKAPKTRRTTVTAVYPSSDVLPENLLRFYIHFSGAMSRGEAYDRVHLFDDSDREVEYPFLTLDQELWDPGMRRFTLLFDPGRVKRGLKPREEFGPALETGRSYRLVIDAGWIDAQGQPLTESFVKTFRVVDPDDVQPRAANWKLEVPPATSREPLHVVFSEPLDHGLLQHMLAVNGPTGEVVPGTVEVIDGETRWLFVPEHPWKPGQYHLIANASLEDRAGNSLRRLFEVDVFEKVTRELQRDFEKRPFIIE